MEQAQFEAMVARLEIESRASPGAYQTRVALLALLGFGVVAAIVGLAGLDLLPRLRALGRGEIARA